MSRMPNFTCCWKWKYPCHLPGPGLGSWDTTKSDPDPAFPSRMLASGGSKAGIAPGSREVTPGFSLPSCHPYGAGRKGNEKSGWLLQKRTLILMIGDPRGRPNAYFYIHDRNQCKTPACHESQEAWRLIGVTKLPCFPIIRMQVVNQPVPKKSELWTTLHGTYLLLNLKSL